MGSKPEIVRAFSAAGWHPADAITLRSSIDIGLSVVLDRPDVEAPVSTLPVEDESRIWLSRSRWDRAPMASSRAVLAGACERRGPNIGTSIVEEVDLQQRIREIGKDIASDYAESAVARRDPEGRVHVHGRPGPAIDLPVEFDFMAVSSYGSATRTSGVVRIMKDLDLDLTDRHVLIVEDIVDSGLTLAYLRKNLAPANPAPLEAARCS